MTVQAQKSTQYYNGPISVGTVLSIVDFTFIDNSHVSAKIRNSSKVWEYGTDYTVTGAGTLIRQFTVLKEVLDGEVLAVYLDVPITQTVAPEEGGKFPAAIQEFTLDKLTYICQMLQERISRSLQISIDTDFNGTLPELLPNRTFKVNSAGTGLILSEYDPDQAIVVVEDFKNAAETAALAASISETNAKASEANAKASEATAAQYKADTDQLKQDTQAIADQAALDISTAKTNAIQAINTEEASAIQAIQPYVDKAKDWATKVDSKVEDIDYSAKYYAEQAAISAGSIALPLFYRVTSDYVLSGNEAKGKLVQGSLVTNLYPDAVAHVKADWDNGTVQTFTLDDITFEYKVAQDKHLIVDIANKTQVDNLFARTGIAEFYILDYTNNQFYLPRNLWFDQYTNDPEQVNKYNEAGLPDLSFTIQESSEGAYTTTTGIAKKSTSGMAVTGQGRNNSGTFIEVTHEFFGKSDTVQPPSSNKLLYFVVGNTYVNQEDIDIAQVESELNNKLNITLDNATQTTKETIVDYNGIDYDMGIKIEASQLFTPEKDGVIVSFATASGAETGVQIYRGNNTTVEYQIGLAISSKSSSTFGSSEIRVTKGKEYNIVMSNPSQVNCKFYPCNGVKE